MPTTLLTYDWDLRPLPLYLSYRCCSYSLLCIFNCPDGCLVSQALYLNAFSYCHLALALSSCPRQKKSCIYPTVQGYPRNEMAIQSPGLILGPGGAGINELLFLTIFSVLVPALGCKSSVLWAVQCLYAINLRALGS